jgi:hypothetical protein
LTITNINGTPIVSGTNQTISVPNGSVYISSTGLIVFTPDPLYTGPIGFPYTISDANGGTDTANVNITVINTDPIAKDDIYTGKI